VTGALDRLAPYVVAAAILGAAAGSSIQRDLFDVGRPLRWILLAVLLAFALARAAVGLRTWSFPPWTAFALAAFCGLALASTAWSVNRHGTLTRALGVSATIVTVAALAGCVHANPALAERMLDGVLAAAVIVAVAGFFYWLVSPSHAVLAATTEYPSRYQGIEQNPNTPPLLLSFGLAIALAHSLDARDARRRVVFVTFIILLAASIVASGARGGLLAAFAGVLAVVVLRPRTNRARIAGVAAAAVALAVGAWITTLPSALPAQPVTPPSRSAAVNRNAEAVLPLSQEIGNPWWTRRNGTSARSLFNTSIRLRALRGTVEDRIAGRPLLGYGFGAEQWAFVNRYYAFDSQNPENGYVGMLLQVGAAGLIVLLAVLALCLVPGVGATWRARDRVAVAAVGAATAGVALALSQSFFHGPGSLASVPFWTALLVTAALSLRVET
jgi:O-antigen ligase